jgi:hypothetical protein
METTTLENLLADLKKGRGAKVLDGAKIDSDNIKIAAV